MMKCKLLGAAVIALGLFLFSRNWKDGAGDTQSEKSSDIVAQETTAFTSGPAAKSPETLPFKFKLRPTQRKPTREETTELLRNTIIPLARIEDLTFREVLVELNRLSAEAGIPPDQLRFICGGPHIFPEHFLDLRMGSIAVRNVPLLSLLKYILDSSKIRFEVGKGVVVFRDSLSTPNLPERPPSGSPDPFAQ